MNRRGFFKALGKMLAETTAVQKLERLSPEAKRRPPGALPESAFLERCSGCDACMIACPFNVILIEDLDRRDPFIYAKEKACINCADAPCIAACAPGALDGRHRNLTSD